MARRIPDSVTKATWMKNILVMQASKAISPAWNQKIARALGTVVVDSRMSVPASMDRKTYVGFMESAFIENDKHERSISQGCSDVRQAEGDGEPGVVVLQS